MLGHPGEARGEREGLDPAEHVLQRVEELEQEPAVEVHRARDVAEEDQANFAPPALPPPELDDLALHQIRPDAPPQVDDPTPPCRTLAPADATGQPLGDQDREAGYFVQVLKREGRKVL